MPLRTPKVSHTVSYRNAAGKTTDAVVIGRQENAPPAPTSSTATTGGTLAAGTFSYRISAVINGIETAASPAKTQVTTGTTSTVTVDWSTIAATSPYSGATAFKVYGRTGGSELLMGTVNMPTTAFTDTGAVTPSGALPAATGSVRLKLIHYKQLVTALKATAMRQASRYYSR